MSSLCFIVSVTLSLSLALTLPFAWVNLCRLIKLSIYMKTHPYQHTHGCREDEKRKSKQKPITAKTNKMLRWSTSLGPGMG